MACPGETRPALTDLGSLIPSVWQNRGAVILQGPPSLQGRDTSAEVGLRSVRL